MCDSAVDTIVVSHLLLLRIYLLFPMRIDLMVLYVLCCPQQKIVIIVVIVLVLLAILALIIGLSVGLKH